MGLLIDFNDSFTFILAHEIRRAGLEIEVVNESTLEGFENLEDFAFIVLSPGPGKPKDHAVMYRVIKKYFSKKPILGICLGFQGIAEYLGGEVIQGEQPVHGKTSLIRHKGSRLYQSVPKEFEVCRYHSLIIKDSVNLKLYDSYAEGQIPMSLSDHENLIWGTQYHPEAILSADGQKVLRNWTEILRSI